MRVGSCMVWMLCTVCIPADVVCGKPASSNYAYKVQGAMLQYSIY